MKFSIITICFNSEKTIERTILSVLAQTYADFEYLIIDGASQDSTLDVVKEYESKFEGRLRWISEPDKGIYNAMNKGIAMAKGDIIGIVNSDDWLENDALKNIVDCQLKAGNLMDAIYCGWINFHYLDGTIQTMKTNHKMLQSWARKYQMAGIRHPAVFVPKNVYNQYGVFDERMKVLADTDFILRLYFRGVSFVYPEKVLSNMSDGGVSNKNLMTACNDYKLILMKYPMNKIKYRYYLCSWTLKRIIKSFVPTKLLWVYRTFLKV